MTRISAMPRLAATSSPAGAVYPYPWKQDGVTLWHNARAAIGQGVKALGLQAGDRVLVPAYTCGAEVDALLHAGLSLAFYRIRPGLGPDLSHLSELSRIPTRALYVIHYFGFPQAIDELLAFARRRSLLLIEDAAQGLYSCDRRGRPLGSLGDMAVFSFPKSLPVPDGGALRLDPALAGEIRPARGGIGQSVAAAGRLKHLAQDSLLQRHRVLARGLGRATANPVTRGLKRMLAGGNVVPVGANMDTIDMHRMMVDPRRAGWGMSSVSRSLMPWVCRPDIVPRRRANYLALHEAFEPGNELAPLFPELPDSCCPLFYPVVAAQAWELSRFLASQRVFYYRIWALFHPAVDMAPFPYESALKRDVVALPIHQDMGTADAVRIAELLNLWNARTRARAASHV